MDKKIKIPTGFGIAIQGPTNFYNKVIEFWKNFDCPVVWATWSDEPAKNVLAIQKAGIDVILLDKPIYPGHLNCNLQFMSTYAGIAELKKLGVTHCLKIRGDCVFYGLESAWPMGPDISFMFSYNPKYLPENRHLGINAGPFLWPEHCYYLDGVLHLGYDWPNDYAIFGKTDIMLEVFSGFQKYAVSVPPEALILKKYIDIMGMKHDFSYEYLSNNGVHYYGQSLITMNADVYCIKYTESMKSLLQQSIGFRLY